MEQKLHNLLYSLPARTAWIVAGSCAAFWLICLTGVLTPPVSAPPSLTLIWFYTMLMLVLASGLAMIGAAAVLVLRRRGLRVSPADAATASATTSATVPATTADAGSDQLAGLGRMLDDPGNHAADSEAPAAVPPAAAPAPDPSSSFSPPTQTRKAPQRKRRKGQR